MDFFGIGLWELLLILLLALLLFGPGRLPDIARGLGKAVREFKRYSSALTREVKEELEDGFKAPSDEPADKLEGKSQSADEK